MSWSSDEAFIAVTVSLLLESAAASDELEVVGAADELLPPAIVTPLNLAPQSARVPLDGQHVTSPLSLRAQNVLSGQKPTILVNEIPRCS